jgi:selenoprotein W-related protein
MTENILQEFESYIDEWTLIPGGGGAFEVEINDDLVYSKLRTGRHAEAGEIRKAFKKAIRG